jgi:hypothetical protein
MKLSIRRAWHMLRTAWPAPAPTHPIFIIGCGRSGTTILGKLLSQHPDVTYLNEPRDLWLADPRTDVWSAKAHARGGRLTLTPRDVDRVYAHRLRAAFAGAAAAPGRGQLIEKLPVNSFRVGYIARIFPDARFIHLLRNGLEVAASIASVAEAFTWYGHDDFKWRLLVDEANARGLDELALLASGDLRLRGLLEWRLSVTSAREALATLSPERVCELHYRELVDDPLGACARLEAFAGLQPSDAMRGFAGRELRRRSPVLAEAQLTQPENRIGGDLLAEITG